MLVRPILLHVQWAGICSCLLTHLEAIVVQNADQITSLQVSCTLNTDCAFRIVHEYKDDKRTMFRLANRMAAGSELNPSKQASFQSAEEGITWRVDNDIYVGVVCPYTTLYNLILPSL